MGQTVSRLGWRLPVIGASIVALLLAGFAAGIATRGVFAQPNGSTIYACKGERSGAVRLVDGPNNCLRGEVLVTWNTVGPVGADGENGVSGYSLATLEPPAFEFQAGTSAIYPVGCPDGTVALSGGWAVTPVAEYLVVHAERSQNHPSIWVFTLYNPSNESPTVNLRLTASCAPVSS